MIRAVARWDKIGTVAHAMTTLDKTIQLVQSRRAIRRYTAEPIPVALLQRLLEATMWAPSAHNRQPWRFAVLTSEGEKAALAKAMGERLRADRTRDGDKAESIEKDVARSFSRICGASAIVAICLTMVDMDSYPDKRRMAAERTMAVQSVAMAAQNLWLLAHAAGLGACWLCAPLFVPALVQQTLDLPADWEPQGLMTMGWPAETKIKERHNWQTRVRFSTKS
jgi:coenzyme F420-0:L-glutamate ligase / coenzyme F420-1:gamma-L-glutamate ligase